MQRFLHARPYAITMVEYAREQNVHAERGLTVLGGWYLPTHSKRGTDNEMSRVQEVDLNRRCFIF